jgi:hypothetical protein
MHVLKKIGLVLSVMLFGPLLLMSVISFSFNRTIGDQAYVEQTFKKAALYDGISQAIIKKAEGEGKSQPLIAASLKTSLSPEVVERLAKPVVSSTYDWLEGDIDQPDFSFSLKDVQKNFESTLKKKLTSRVKKLPPCGYANVSSSTSVYTLTCLPPGFDSQQAIRDAVKRVSANADIFNDASVKDKKLDQKEVQDLGINAIPEKPAETIPATYQAITESLPWFILGTILTGAGLVFLSVRKLLGLRKIGVILVLTGVGLFGFSLIMNYALGSLVPSASVSATEAPVNALENAAKMIIADNSNLFRASGLAAIVAGLLGIVLCTKKLRHETGKSKK